MGTKCWISIEKNTHCKFKIWADERPPIFTFCKLRSMATAPLPLAICNPGKSKGSIGGILNLANPKKQKLNYN